ncbi:MAG: hypothetical protein EXR51_09005 [Dehalococcoidia bacterium]|nr:hypothetical protein [Dehalococcoidia bacterium]
MKKQKVDHQATPEVDSPEELQARVMRNPALVSAIKEGHAAKSDQLVSAKELACKHPEHAL